MIPMPPLTIDSHTQAASGNYTLVVRVPDTAPERLAAIVGDATWAPVAVDEQPTDTLHTTEWAADTEPAYQRGEVRLLIEQALAAAPAAPSPAPVTEPGTEL